MHDSAQPYPGRGGGWVPDTGAVLNGAAVPALDRRRSFAAELGFSETMFIDISDITGITGVADTTDPGPGGVHRVDILMPSTRLSFAGHLLVGAAWLSRRVGRPARALRPPAASQILTRPHADTRIDVGARGVRTRVRALEL